LQQPSEFAPVLPADFRVDQRKHRNSLLFSLLAGNCAYRDRFESDCVRHLNQFEFPKVFGWIVKSGLQCPRSGLSGHGLLRGTCLLLRSLWGGKRYRFLQRICLLLTQSGHSDLQTSIFSLAILTRTPNQLNRDSRVDGRNWLP